MPSRLVLVVYLWWLVPAGLLAEELQRDQGHPQSEWLAALSADQTLSEPVRQRALQFAREWK